MFVLRLKEVGTCVQSAPEHKSGLKVSSKIKQIQNYELVKKGHIGINE